MIQAKIIGAGGYGGVGITELLLKHPKIDIASLVSLSDTGRLMSEVFPHLKGYCDKIIFTEIFWVCCSTFNISKYFKFSTAS